LCACHSEKHYSQGDSHPANTSQTYGTQTTSTARDSTATNYDNSTTGMSAGASATTTTKSSGHSTAAGMSALSQRDREFVEKAVQGGMLEVESSRLAISKNVAGSDRKFADAMISDHGKANRELEDLLRKKGVTPASTLDRDHQAKLDELRDKQGTAFAAAYREMQIKAHDKAIELFERAERDSDDKDLKAFASKTLPTLRHHRSMLDEKPDTTEGALG
jgi:putative membrane protein